MYSIIFWFVIGLLDQCSWIESSVTHRFTIGAVLSSKQSREFFLQEIDNVQKELPQVQLRAHTVPMHANPIQTANEVCTKLIPHQVDRAFIC